MRIKFLVRPALLLLVLAALTVGAAAQKKKTRIKPIRATVTVSASNPTPAQRRQEAFFMAWHTLDQHYFDKTFGGLDWNKIRKEYETRVKAARTDAAFHQILQEMIDRLGKSHLNIIVPEYFETLENAKVKARVRGKELAAEKRAAAGDAADDVSEDEDELFGDAARMRYGIGVELRMLADQVVITRIDKQSGAAIAGLKAGFVIDKINGVSLTDVVRQSVIAGNSLEEIRYLLPIEIVESFLNGDPETSVFLTCLDETDKPKEFTVPRLELAGEAISISKNLPEQFLKYEALSLSADVGYIKFNAFAIPVIGKFCDSLTEFGDKKALIVDLRGNLGGILGSMIGLSGMLTDRPLTLGTFVSRAGSAPFTAESRIKNFKGRIVLLVDGQSMSAAEMFTAGLQGSRRAVVVGERTGGQSLPAVWIKLSTGAVMVYPVADFITARGTSLEGTGLEPDHMVALDRRSLLQGIDPQLQKALVLTADESAFPKRPETKPEPVADIISTSGPPPPPPPKALTKLAPAPTPAPSDARSLKLIADFTAAVGGSPALKRISSYEVKGSVVIGENGEADGDIYAARQFPDKAVIVINSPSMGETREIYNGKTSFLQADYGIDRSLYPNIDTTGVHLLSPFFNALDLEYLRGLKYEGEYEVEGRMRQVLSATSPSGHSVGLSFDVGTKMLVTFSLPGVLYTLSDYRRIDGVSIPFRIDMDRIMNIHLTSVTINPKLDASNFEKKEKCFDKAN